MSITPINLIDTNQWLQTQGSAAKLQENTGVPFQNMLESMIDEIDALEAQKSQDAFDLALGNVDDPAILTVNSTKADFAIQSFVEIRNKLLDAYSEIMRMSL